MCYSAMIKQSAKKFGLIFNVREQIDIDEFWEHRVFPHQEFPVVLETNEGRYVKWMNYSLVPKWSKVRKPKFVTYNARVESICEKATWKQPIQSQRCLIGFNSFFESCYEGTHAGNVVEFSSKELVTAAGIYEQWVDKTTGEVVDSFAMITTTPSPFIKNVGHDRSPVFLPASTFEEWLNPKKMSCSAAKEFLLQKKIQPEFEVEIERPLNPGWEKRK